LPRELQKLGEKDARLGKKKGIRDRRKFEKNGGEVLLILTEGLGILEVRGVKREFQKGTVGTRKQKRGEEGDVEGGKR